MKQWRKTKARTQKQLINILCGIAASHKILYYDTDSIIKGGAKNVSTESEPDEEPTENNT